MDMYETMKKLGIENTVFGATSSHVFDGDKTKKYKVYVPTIHTPMKYK